MSEATAEKPAVPDPPRKAFRLELVADGHTLEDLRANVDYLMSHYSDEHESSLTTSGGWLIVQHGTKPADQYYRELQEYLDASRGNRSSEG